MSKNNSDVVFIGMMIVIYGLVIVLSVAMFVAHIVRANKAAEQAMNAANYERVYLAGGVK